jgi:hypothetical protein
MKNLFKHVLVAAFLSFSLVASGVAQPVNSSSFGQFDQKDKKKEPEKPRENDKGPRSEDRQKDKKDDKKKP